MTDLLQYPSCKLYENGSFRLPVKIRKELISRRFKRLVIAADEKGCCVMYSVSFWDKNKKRLECEIIVNCPQYPQAISKTHLHLHQKLVNHLENPNKLYFELNGNSCTIYSEKSYALLNFREKEKLNKLYEML